MGYSPRRYPGYSESHGGIYLTEGMACNPVQVAAMSPSKPATMWNTRVPSPAEFELGLLHGIFPMAPAPSGDHSLGMSGLPQFLTYGPSRARLRLGPC